MTPLELLVSLRASGVVLRPLVTRLQVDAPTSALTPALREALREHKVALLDLVVVFEERAAIAEYAGGVPRAEAGGRRPAPPGLVTAARGLLLRGAHAATRRAAAQTSYVNPDGPPGNPVNDGYAPVSAEPFLSAASRTLFESIWKSAAYQPEWCEPFFTNSRAAIFPMARTWALQSGRLPPILEVRCISQTSNEYTYVLLASDRSTIESGIFVSDPVRKPLATVDFRPSSGTTRLGVWEVISNTLQLNLGAPGGTRSSSLTGAATYTTR